MPDTRTQIGSEVLTDEIKDMFLNFTVGEEVYGVEIRYVLQIVGMQKITEMPEMPPGMKGFINLRGSVIPVCSMYSRFGKEEPEYTERTCIIVIQIDEKLTGLIVDAIQETVTIESDSVSPPPSLGPAEGSPYVKGIARFSEGKIVILLDTLRLLEE
jgi:purine-binding chemotaxis protein CheW